MNGLLIDIKGVSKKFSRNVKKSLIYGLQDIVSEMFSDQASQQLRESEFWALQNVSFPVGRGDAVGLIGVNGCGKTTLLKIIANILKPNQGTVSVKGTIAPLIALGAGFNPMLSGKENISLNLSLLGLTRSEIKDRFESIVDFAELRDVLNAPVRTYSSGMKARLGFSCAIHLNPDVLLVDEALAVGDARFRVKCYQRLAKMRTEGTSFILVSHSAAAITSICNRAIYLKKGNVRYDGKAADAVQIYKKDQTARTAVARTVEKSLVTPDRYVRIDSVELLPLKNGGARSGEPLSIKINILSDRVIDDLAASIIIRPAGTTGLDSLVLNSNLESKSFKIKEGRASIQLGFPFLGLPGGEYTLKVSIFRCKNTLEVLDIVGDTTLVVDGRTEMASSSYYQPHSWEVDLNGGGTELQSPLVQ